MFFLIPSAGASPRCTFGVRKPSLFGLRAGATAKNSAVVDADYKRAEEAIFHGMEAVEAKVQKAVEQEVHSIFDAGIKHKEIAAHAKKEKQQHHNNSKDTAAAENLILHVIEDAEKATVHAIEAAEKATVAAARADVQRRSEVTEYTNQALAESVEKAKGVVHDYIEKRQTHFWPKDAIEQHEDRALLHAIESVEKAVLHGVQEEVDTLFHDTHETKDQQSNHPKRNSPKKDR